MQKAFAPHASWSDLNDESSKFVQFLNTVAKEENGKYSVFTLRVLSILWCEGSPKEKATEFYENLQDALQDKIACNDKDFKPNLYRLYELATVMVFKNEPLFMGTDDLETISNERIAEAKEKYDDLAE